MGLMGGTGVIGRDDSCMSVMGYVSVGVGWIFLAFV